MSTDAVSGNGAAKPEDVAAAPTGNASDSSLKLITVDGKQYQAVREGLAEILVPHAPAETGDGDGDGEAKKKPASNASKKARPNIQTDGQSVFYNPIQQFNRDLSMLATRVFAEELVAQRTAKRARTLAMANGRGAKGKKGKNGGAKGDGGAVTAAPEAPDAGKPEAGDGVAGVQAANGAQADVQQTESPSEQDAAAPKSGEGTSSKRKRDDLPSSGEQVPDTKKARIEEESPEPTIITSQTTAKTGAKPPPTNKQSEPQPYIPFRILDALSATGLRALRYCKEVPQTTSVTANDLSPEAVKSIQRSVEHNGLKGKILPILGNAMGHMYFIGSEQIPRQPDGTTGKYDVIDLDPYGTAAPFLDSAVQAVNDGGMLAVTCTDSAIYASVGYMEKTFAQYGGVPWRGSASHEAGLRLIIQSIATSAARYGLAIEPLLSLSIDYYTRAFIRVRRSAEEVKKLPGKTMVVYNCDYGCGAWTKQFMARTTPRINRNGATIYHFSLAQAPATNARCEHCDSKMHLAGPMWGGPLHNPFFVQRMLDKIPELDEKVYGTIPRMEGMLSTALHETLMPPDVSQVKLDPDGKNGRPKADDAAATEHHPDPARPPAFTPLERLDPYLPDHHPFFFTASEISRVLRCNVPSDAQLRGALKHLGYRMTRSHARPGSIKTDAPFSVIWDVMRAWVKQRAPIKEGALKEGSAGWRILRNDDQSENLRDVEGALRKVMDGNEGKVRAAMAVVEEMRKKEKADRAPKDGSRVDAAGGETGDAAASEEAGKAGEAGEDSSVAVDGQRRQIVFDEELGKETDKRRLVRYQHNPRGNWGPQARAR